MNLTLRLALDGDTPSLTELIAASVRGLQSADYTSEQLEEALRSVYGVDTQLIHDATYFVAEVDGAIVACGGWSKRRTLFGADHCAGREDSLLDPACDAARIRAFFVHPDWVRRGIGARVLEACEEAARSQGFSRFEMGATLTGVALYKARGYREVERIEVPLAGGVVLPIVRMSKQGHQKPSAKSPCPRGA
jgi:GNAT superfamily N-acetyltransferase